MKLSQPQMLQILRDNPQVDLVCNDPTSSEGHFIIQTHHANAKLPHTLPEDVDPTKCIERLKPKITTLELKTDRLGPTNRNQQCQNEPISMGTQIQPQGAPWVGTAGCPVRWTDTNGNLHWGILSNWHVFTGGRYDLGHPQHQPTDGRPACAQLTNFTPVLADQPNTTDAAIADALIDGYHTIAWSILELGKLNPEISPAVVGNHFRKVGRTTGLTHARCSAINAGVRVNYGDFEAIFLGQDVFDDVEGSFSAPGDSGSTIVCDCNHGPSALLFAGGGNQTIGNPMELVAATLNLFFDP